MMLVHDTPVAIDVPKSNRQPERETALLRGAGEGAGTAPHDGDGKGDIFAGGKGQLLDVERL
jgi:hypothetical protein